MPNDDESEGECGPKCFVVASCEHPTTGYRNENVWSHEIVGDEGVGWMFGRLNDKTKRDLASLTGMKLFIDEFSMSRARLVSYSDWSIMDDRACRDTFAN